MSLEVHSGLCIHFYAWFCVQEDQKKGSGQWSSNTVLDLSHTRIHSRNKRYLHVPVMGQSPTGALSQWPGFPSRNLFSHGEKIHASKRLNKYGFQKIRVLVNSCLERTVVPISVRSYLQLHNMLKIYCPCGSSLCNKNITKKLVICNKWLAQMFVLMHFVFKSLTNQMEAFTFLTNWMDRCILKKIK